MGAKYSFKAVLQLALWRRQYISKEGRLRLIKSSLSNLPTYTLSLFRIPRGMSSRLERIQRDFIWGGGKLEKKQVETVCLNKNKGGLGIHNLSTLNSALLGKWSWRFATEEDSTWRKLVVLKYGADEGSGSPIPPKAVLGLVCGKKLERKLPYYNMTLL